MPPKNANKTKSRDRSIPPQVQDQAEPSTSHEPKKVTMSEENSPKPETQPEKRISPPYVGGDFLLPSRRPNVPYFSAGSRRHPQNLVGDALVAFEHSAFLTCQTGGWDGMGWYGDVQFELHGDYLHCDVHIPLFPNINPSCSGESYLCFGAAAKLFFMALEEHCGINVPQHIRKRFGQPQEDRAAAARKVLAGEANDMRGAKTPEGMQRGRSTGRSTFGNTQGRSKSRDNQSRGPRAKSAEPKQVKAMPEYAGPGKAHFTRVCDDPYNEHPKLMVEYDLAPRYDSDGKQKPPFILAHEVTVGSPEGDRGIKAMVELLKAGVPEIYGHVDPKAAAAAYLHLVEQVKQVVAVAKPTKAGVIVSNSQGTVLKCLYAAAKHQVEALDSTRTITKLGAIVEKRTTHTETETPPAPKPQRPQRQSAEEPEVTPLSKAAKKRARKEAALRRRAEATDDEEVVEEEIVVEDNNGFVLCKIHNTMYADDHHCIACKEQQ